MYTEQFDALEYFRSLAEKNRLCVENGFKGCLCSGIDGVEGVMAKYQTTANFVMVDDITAGATRETSDGFYERNTYTIFIFARYKQLNIEDYNEKMRLCRRIFHQYVSRIIYDQDHGELQGMESFQMDNILSTEFGRASFTGLCGLMFHIDNDEPVDVVYEAGDWL